MVDGMFLVKKRARRIKTLFAYGWISANSILTASGCAGLNDPTKKRNESK